MAQKVLRGRCHGQALLAQQRDEDWERMASGASSSAQPAAWKFCDDSIEQQPQPEEREPSCKPSPPSLGTPQSLLAPPITSVHRFMKAAGSDDEDCGRSFSAAAGAAGAVARFEMEESALGESDDGESCCSSSTFTNSCGGGHSPGASNSGSSSHSSSISSIGSARGSLPAAWGARSKLPFHMLPFEVQAYHLQQQKLRQTHKHSRNAGRIGAASITRRGSSSSSINSSSSSTLHGSGADPAPLEAPLLPADEEDEQSAVVESAWFPLMPPAMAGETRPAAGPPDSTSQGREEHVEISSDDTYGVTMTCSPRDADTAGARPEEARQRSGRHRQGFGRCWAGAAGDVIHLTALQFPRGTIANSTATTASASSATLSSTSSCEGFDGCEDGGARPEAIGGWPPRWASLASPAHSPLPPTEPPSPTVTTATLLEAEEATAVAVAEPLANPESHRSHNQPPPAAAAAAAAALLGDHLDGPRAGQNEALTLVALSGFAPRGAATLQAVSLDLSNACRALAAWSLRVVVDGNADRDWRSSNGGGDDGEPRRGCDASDEYGRSVAVMPPHLAEHVWPRSSAPGAARREPSLGNGSTNTSNGHNTRGRGSGWSNSGHSRRHTPAAGSPATATETRLSASGRLQPRRWITRVKVESTGRRRGGVALASWPATMIRLEFGDRFNGPVEGIGLPEGLRVVKFGARFNQPVSRIRWPASLRELSFGNDFNQPVSGIDFPPGVRRLDFGGRFNFVVSAVDLPEELRELRFGHGFNREIASVRWPPKLSKLEFCGELQQKVEEVAWPGSLTHLALLGDFDQPVQAVHWPAGLVTIRFGDCFQQPLSGVTSWPPGLETVVLGRGYGKSLCGCALLPGPEGESGGSFQLQVQRSGGGDGSDLAVDKGRDLEKHQPVRDAVLRVLVSFECDEQAGGDGRVGIDDASCGVASTGAIHPEVPTLRADTGHGRRLGMEAGGAAEDEGLIFGDVSTDGDVEHERYWDDEDEDGGGGGRGLPYVDVFGFEDAAWEMEDPCFSLSGTY